MLYDSGYTDLEKTYYGDGTLDVIISQFLVKLYSNPRQFITTRGRINLHVLCLMFGECPRLMAAMKFIEKHKDREHQTCANENAHSLKFGNLLRSLVLSWSNTGDSALLLLLSQFENIIKEDLTASHPGGRFMARFSELS